MRLSRCLLKTVIAITVLLGFTGCTPIVFVAGAVGGYAISRDTFEGVSAHALDELWDASNKVVSIMGTISDSDKSKYQIIGRVNGTDIVLTLYPVNLTTTKIRIKARRLMLPRVSVAQEVYTKIMNQLER